uniref:intestinal mucin-like protein n=1 Tax=Monopterus albus TaxID=43700 RepID=UPI0009B3CDD6|nr:intestinal mucin-like protein [Monopterus albus]
MIYLEGDIVYNVTDGMGWCYMAYCNSSCQIEKHSVPCPTTPMPGTTTGFNTTGTTLLELVSPTTTSFSTSISSTTLSTTTMDCNSVSPTRKNGENWRVDNCTTATCTNGNVKETPDPCPTVEQPICANGRKAVQVNDKNGCCFHYECECVCSGWGGSHYMTFDGTSYSFNMKCSYYLVKEIITKYNLAIIVNNHDCDPSDSTFCPQDLTVIYGSNKIVLTQLKTSNGTTNVVYVNEKRIYPAFCDSTMSITSTDMVITLDILDSNVNVVYRGGSFSISLPYSLFGGKTEGQCGTCDNSQKNDCRPPNGQAGDCPDTAGQWQVPGTPCITPTTQPTFTAPRTTPQTPHSTTAPICRPAICDLLTSGVFAPCHEVIPPGPFVTSCSSDICNGLNNTCSSLEAYATQCSNAGICIDWRTSTDGQCERQCPSNKVFMACGPSVEPTCNSRYNEKFQTSNKTSTNSTKEGCFCPSGTTLFNTVYDTCVTSCDCVGPDGQPKEPGDTWTSECNTCVCDKDSMSIQCEPIQCPSVESPDCSLPGQQLVNNTDGCCSTPACECNVNLCPPPITCPLGFGLSATSGTCCQSYECVPKGVCVYNMAEYQVSTQFKPETTICQASGTCDNSQKNDCRPPNGQAGDCPDTAGQWQVPGTPCITPTTQPTTTAPRTTPQTPHSTTAPICRPAICDLLTSGVFAPCHEVIPPGPFVTSCSSDICNGLNNTCSSLEAYATQCSNAGICIDWRTSTDGQCERQCPSNKVFMACGPSVEPTCNSRYNEKFQTSNKTSTNSTKEGCFCPSGTTLFNTVYDTCVTSCDCVGPDGQPKEPGDTWTSECNTCVCDKDSMSIQCEPIQCPSVESPDCSLPGQQLVNNTDGCCSTPACECNVNLCPPPITCPLGFGLSATSGTCCQSYECVPKGVCVYNMAEYQPGATILTSHTPPESPLEEPGTTAAPSKSEATTPEPTSNEPFKPGPCQDCSCGPQMDPNTKLNIIDCKPVVCNKNCTDGYEYQTDPDKCCGTCVQKSCVVTTPDSTTHIIEVNSTFVPTNDNCLEYSCEIINGQLSTKETRTTCPPFNPSDCVPGTITTDANGCCKTCKIQSVCELQSEQSVIEVNGCKSAQPVKLTSCAGHCGSSSMYSAATNKMMPQCECCKEATTSDRQVELICADGSKLMHSIIVVETCSCNKVECTAWTTSKP